MLLQAEGRRVSDVSRMSVASTATTRTQYESIQGLVLPGPAGTIQYSTVQGLVPAGTLL